MSGGGSPPPRPSTARRSVPPVTAVRELPRPRAVTVSFWSWCVATVLVGAAVAMVATKIGPMRAEFARLAREADSAASGETVDQVGAVAVMLVIGVGTFLAVLELLLAAAMRARRNGARLLLMLFAALGVAYGLVVASAVTEAMVGDLHDEVRVGLLAYATAALVGAVCLFPPSAKTWFR